MTFIQMGKSLSTMIFVKKIETAQIAIAARKYNANNIGFLFSFILFPPPRLVPFRPVRKFRQNT